MTAFRHRRELLVLQALRLAGVADAERISDRALLGPEAVEEVLDRAVAERFVEELALGQLRGRVLTERGQGHLAGLLAEDREASGARDGLTAVLADFEAGINADLVSEISAWQRQESGDREDGPSFGTLLDRLDALAADLNTLLAPILPDLPRLGRYPAQFAIAVRRARTEGERWVSGPGILSAHVVWAELHQDLLSTLGRTRTPDRPSPGGSP